MQIDRVTLSAKNLEAQRQFYGEVLGLPVRLETDSLYVQAGRTELIFQADAAVAPFYHLAFRVSTNDPMMAVEWTRNRVALLADGEERLFHSSLWNSTQFYFCDGDGNVLEFLTTESEVPVEFGPNSILYVTEVGLPVADVLATVADLERSLGEPRKNGESATFNPVGNADGLLIIVPAGRNWYPTQQPAFTLPVRVEVRAPIAEPVELVTPAYQILARPS